jgi:hypothetical protein
MIYTPPITQLNGETMIIITGSRDELVEHTTVIPWSDVG